jgi:deazaflavin-dependent oxidoreductase (nitroreductase family)
MGNFVFRLFTGIHARLYKLTGGRLTGGGSVIIVRHKGAKSGKVRETPLMSFRDGEEYFVVASAGGSPRNPGWYYNLMANPATVINDRGTEIAVIASDAGARRNELWAKVVANSKQFAGYEDKTEREIPIVVLTPR